MAQTTMYSGIDNSPKTIITNNISATDSLIAVENVAMLPDGPNLATLGTGNNAEVIYYATISNNELQNCVRGIGGTARIWPAGTNIYRAYTNKDHQAFIDNILDLATNKLDAKGNASDLTVTFTEASSRANITTGETIATLFGKVAKWFSDIKALAFKASIGTDDINEKTVTNTKLANMSAKSLKGNSSSETAAPEDLSASTVRSMLNVSDGADVTKTALENVEAIESLSDDDRIILSDTSSPSGSRIKYALWSALKTSMQTALQAVYAPLSHASRHASTGQDAISPSAIGAAVPAKEIETTLLANGWVDSTYTLSGLVDITTESKGVVGLSDAASIEQRAAARSAQLSKIGQSAGSITIVSDGIVPTVDIPITIMIIS